MNTPYLTAQEHREFGQRYHGVGAFPEALEHFRMGYDVAVESADELQAAAIARGAGTSSFRIGDQIASDDWLSVSVKHGFRALNAASTDEARQEARRELLIHGITVGRFALIRAVTAELSGDVNSAETGRAAKRRLWLARLALPEVEKDGTPDQYRIDGIHAMSISETLFGDRHEGRALAVQALQLAPRSESPRLPTSSDLGPRNRFHAVKRASARAVAANVIALTPQTEKGRRFVSDLALKVI